jgi:hypothetical protein
MIGLFQGKSHLPLPPLLVLTIPAENGPCTVAASGKTTVLNPFSWNTVSNSTSLSLLSFVG